MIRILTFAIAVIAGCSHAWAAFYLEGIVPFQQAPNCTDPYAIACGRYGQVPHDPDAAPPGWSFDGNAPRGLQEEFPKAQESGEMAPRTRTREGLEK